jgi:phospholipid/cholesterol/gamma-HCH transport system substrate-binding protein
MEYRKNEIRAGIFILVSFSILVVLLFAVSDLKGIFKKREEFKVIFTASEGLEKNASVRYAGIRIGRVSDMRVVPELGGKVELTLSIYEEAAIKEDVKVSIKTTGLVGKKYVSLEGGSPEAKPLMTGAVLYGGESQSMEDLTKMGLEVAGKLKHIAGNLDRLLGDPALSKSIKGTVLNVQEVTEDIKGVVLNAQEVTENVKVMTSSKEEVAQSLKNLPELLKKLDASVANLKEITDKTDKIVGENTKNVDATMENLKEITTNLKELTDDVKKHPWKLIRKP